MQHRIIEVVDLIADYVCWSFLIVMMKNLLKIDLQKTKEFTEISSLVFLAHGVVIINS